MSQEMIVGDPRSVLATISRPELVNLLLVESRERAKKRIREIQSILRGLLDRYEGKVKQAYALWVHDVEGRVRDGVKLPKGYSWGAWVNVPQVEEITVEKDRYGVGLLQGSGGAELTYGAIKGVDFRQKPKANKTKTREMRNGPPDFVHQHFFPVYFNEALMSPADSPGDPGALQDGEQTHLGVLKEKRSGDQPESIILWRAVKAAMNGDSRVASISFYMPIPIKMDLTIPKDTLADLKGIMDQVYSLRAEAAGLQEFCHEKGTPEQERALLAALTRSALAAEGVSLDFNNLLPPLLTAGETPIK